jgi:hypothetical protein
MQARLYYSLFQFQVAKAIEEEENKWNLRQQQQPQQPVYYQTLRSTIQSQGNPIPSKTFQRLERKYSVESDRSISPSSFARFTVNDNDDRKKGKLSGMNCLFSKM